MAENTAEQLKSPSSEPIQAQRQDVTSQWYIPSIDKYLVPDTRRLLSEYAHVPEAQQSAHVHEIREKLWAIRKYPCTGLGVFLTPYIAKSPAYPKILAKLKDGGIYLDIGCFCGTDMRQACFDGAPSTNMVGIDIVSHWEVGFDMYNDRDRFQAKYIEADLLKTTAVPELVALQSKADVINVSAVLHAWPYDVQLQAAKEIVSFSKVGTVVVGYQIGAIKAKAVQIGVAKSYRHDAESFAKLWEEAGTQTGTKWAAEVQGRTWQYIGWDENDMGWLGEGSTVLDFVVTRL